MAVGFNVEFDWYEIGSGDFLYSFFSTVACRLEGNHWGKRFPKIMKELYHGSLPHADIEEGIREMAVIREELRAFAPSQVVWDFDDLQKQPPWGDNISPEITDLSQYFVTGDGEDFFEVALDAMQEAKKRRVPLEIESL